MQNRTRVGKPEYDIKEEPISGIHNIIMLTTTEQFVDPKNQQKSEKVTIQELNEADKTIRETITYYEINEKNKKNIGQENNTLREKDSRFNEVKNFIYQIKNLKSQTPEIETKETSSEKAPDFVVHRGSRKAEEKKKQLEEKRLKKIEDKKQREAEKLLREQEVQRLQEEAQRKREEALRAQQEEEKQKEAERLLREQEAQRKREEAEKLQKEAAIKREKEAALKELFDAIRLTDKAQQEPLPTLKDILKQRQESITAKAQEIADARLKRVEDNIKLRWLRDYLKEDEILLLKEEYLNAIEKSTAANIQKTYVPFLENDKQIREWLEKYPDSFIWESIEDEEEKKEMMLAWIDHFRLKANMLRSSSPDLQMDITFQQFDALQKKYKQRNDENSLYKVNEDKKQFSLLYFQANANFESASDGSRELTSKKHTQNLASFLPKASTRKEQLVKQQEVELKAKQEQERQKQQELLRQQQEKELKAKEEEGRLKEQKLLTELREKDLQEKKSKKKNSSAARMPNDRETKKIEGRRKEMDLQKPVPNAFTVDKTSPESADAQKFRYRLQEFIQIALINKLFPEDHQQGNNFFDNTLKHALETAKIVIEKPLNQVTHEDIKKLAELENALLAERNVFTDVRRDDQLLQAIREFAREYRNIHPIVEAEVSQEKVRAKARANKFKDYILKRKADAGFEINEINPLLSLETTKVEEEKLSKNYLSMFGRYSALNKIEAAKKMWILLDPDKTDEEKDLVKFTPKDFAALDDKRLKGLMTELTTNKTLPDRFVNQKDTYDKKEAKLMAAIAARIRH